MAWPWPAVLLREAVSPPARWRSNAPTSTAARSRRARPNALRRTADSRQSSAGCTQAPRPGNRCLGSGHSTTGDDPPGTVSVAATTRSKADQLSVPRHPTHVRDGSARSPVRSATHQSTAPTDGRGPRHTSSVGSTGCGRTPRGPGARSARGTAGIGVGRGPPRSPRCRSSPLEARP